MLKSNQPSLTYVIIPLYPSKVLILTFANSEDPNELPHHAAFQQGLQNLFRQKGSPEKEVHFYLESITCYPLIDTPMFIVSNQKEESMTK